ncbi:MAG TPA: TIGR04222 domain-containing membrane protein [Candidatus Obscuribacterales bacterium]
MNIEQAELYDRIQRFGLDDVDADLSFSKRLARENGWTVQYTQRVIAEYKRFAFLAVVAGHPVSPPHPIDEAWHLHLLYTRSYWGYFCPKVLQVPLHHEPTREGGSEHEKFNSWYAKTLSSYEVWFEKIPPSDIWSSPSGPVLQGRQTGKAPIGNRVLTYFRSNRRTIVVSSFLFTLAITSFTPSIASSIGTNAATLSNPLDFTGYEFLGFYFQLLSVVTLFACGLRWYFWQLGHQVSTQAPQLNTYETAYLAGGKSRVVEVAIAHLVEHKHLRLLPTERAFQIGLPLPSNSHFLERAVVRAVSKGGSIEDVRSLVEPLTAPISTHLQELGLLINQSQAKLAEWLVVLSVLAVLLLGISKILVGAVQDKPVGFLFMFCLVTTVIAGLLSIKPHRNRYGDSVLKKLQRQHINLQHHWQAAELALAMALFGETVLADTALADLQQVFVPPAGASGDGGGGCGSGCGGCGGG